LPLRRLADVVSSPKIQSDGRWVKKKRDHPLMWSHAQVSRQSQRRAVAG
jgi:hypothetical protein